MSSMKFPKASDYYAQHEPIQVSNTGIDPKVALPEFHFGQQPIGFKDLDADRGDGTPRKIAVIGCGSAYKIFSDTALRQRGTQCYIVDTASDAAIEKAIGRPLDPAREIRVDSTDELPADIDYAAILTPPPHHAAYIREFQKRGIPMMVEKPIVSNGKLLNGPGHLEDVLEECGQAPLYAMDWEVLLATPLMAALNMNPAFEGIVEFSKGAKENFAAFDKHNLTRIETTFVEGGDNPLAGKQDRGGWLWDISRGGGGLYDMGVHALNTTAVLGFTPDTKTIRDVKLGAPNFGGTQGVYQAVGNRVEPIPGMPREGVGNTTRPIAEMYGRAEFDSIVDGKHVPTLLECGKGGSQNDMRVTLTDKNGMVLNWVYGPDLSEVTLTDKDGKELAKAASHIDPYALMYEEATHFFAREKAAKQADPEGYKPTALYYDEHANVLHTLDAIQSKGREHSVPANDDLVLQLAYEGTTKPLGKYTENIQPSGRVNSYKSDWGLGAA